MGGTPRRRARGLRRTALDRPSRHAGLPQVDRATACRRLAIGYLLDCRSPVESATPPVPPKVQPGQGDGAGPALASKEAKSDGSETGESRKATWFATATDDALYPDLLKKAARDGRIKKVGSGRGVQYIVESVCSEYPQYRPRLEAALARDRNQSEPVGTKRND